jgi:hypothetical protein
MAAGGYLLFTCHMGRPFLILSLFNFSFGRWESDIEEEWKDQRSLIGVSLIYELRPCAAERGPMLVPIPKVSVTSAVKRSP